MVTDMIYATAAEVIARQNLNCSQSVVQAQGAAAAMMVYRLAKTAGVESLYAGNSADYNEQFKWCEIYAVMYHLTPVLAAISGDMGVTKKTASHLESPDLIGADEVAGRQSYFRQQVELLLQDVKNDQASDTDEGIVSGSGIVIIDL